MSKLRTILAWVLAIAAFAFVEASASYLGAKIGVPTSIAGFYTPYYGRGIEGIERSSSQTGFGLNVELFSILAAVAIWHLVQGRQFTPDGRANYLGFLVGNVIMIVGGIPIWKLFHGSLVGNLFEVGLFGVAVVHGYGLYNDLKRSDSTLYALVDRVWHLDPFRREAEQGSADAQHDLGMMYADGGVVPQDDAEAVRWFRRAADQGNASGQFRLGVMYEFGRGVPQDDAEAARWYRLAAEQGHTIAQGYLKLIQKTR